MTNVYRAASTLALYFMLAFPPWLLLATCLDGCDYGFGVTVAAWSILFSAWGAVVTRAIMRRGAVK